MAHVVLNFPTVKLELISVIFLTASTPLSMAPHTVTVDVVSFEQVEYSEDSARVTARAADGTLYVHDTTTGDVVGMGLVGSSAEGQSPRATVPVAVSADRLLVVTGDRDGVVRVRVAASNEIIVEYKGHLGTITDIAISPDGSQIASVGDDGLGLFWPMP